MADTFKPIVMIVCITMSFESENYKQESRLPMELARAILDHACTPRLSFASGLSYREKLCCDYGSLELQNHLVLNERGSRILWALKSLEDDLPLDREDRLDLRHALEVTDFYRQQCERNRDRLKNASTTTLSHCRDHERNQLAKEYQREAADDMESCFVEINNLNAIDKLTRALARKLGIVLVRPVRGK